MGDLPSVMWNFNLNYSIVRKNYVLLPFWRPCLRLEHYLFACCLCSVHLVEHGGSKDLRNRSDGYSPASYTESQIFNFRQIHLGFVVDKVTLGEVFCDH